MLAVLLVLPGISHATLGGLAASVQSDRKAMAAAEVVTAQGKGFTVQEFTTPSTTVREYLSSDGIVFGIAWNGLVHPDLTPLLGSYAAEYQNALQKTPRRPGRRAQKVQTSKVVVEKWGHMRNLQGRAYAPDLVPQGVSIDEIK